MPSRPSPNSQRKVTKRKVTKRKVTKRKVTKRKVSKRKVTKRKVTKRKVTKRKVTKRKVTKRKVTKRKVTKRSSTANGSRRPRRAWTRLPNERLLDLRLCDLDLRIEGSGLEKPITRLFRELKRRNVRHRPHFWLSEEWFSPEGIPGVAIPFYLAHPRLMRLERSQMFEVEGGNFDWCMKILRHETGHAIQHAYNLHRRRRWQQLFGRSSQAYPEVYNPNPGSKRYVLNLYLWYAQSHPDEDFAETFAVWLRPQAMWRKRYAGWPALKKLEYVDELMTELADEPPPVRTRRHFEPLRTLRKTLRQHYAEKQDKFGGSFPDMYDRDLGRLFSSEAKHRRKESASAFLRRNRREIRSMVSRWTGEYEFTLDQMFSDMQGRCRELRLRVVGSERQTKLDFAILLTVRTMQYIYSRRDWHPI